MLIGLPTALILIGYPILIAAVVLEYVLLYKCWAAIQGPHARTTPESAVLFHFIPFFNLYWVFNARFGLSKDMAATMRARGLGGPYPSISPLVGALICALFAWIPVLGWFVALPACFVFQIVGRAQQVSGARRLLEQDAELP